MRRPHNRAPLGLALALCLLCNVPAQAQTLGRLFTSPAERAALDRARLSAPPAVASGPSGQASAPAVGGPATQAALAAFAALTAPAAPTGAASGAAPAGTPLAAALAGSRVLVVNGVVRRSDGVPVMAWVDATAYPGPARLRAGARLTAVHGDRVTLVLRSGQRATLKPGQQVDAGGGAVREAGAAAPRRPPGTSVSEPVY